MFPGSREREKGVTGDGSDRRRGGGGGGRETGGERPRSSAWHRTNCRFHLCVYRQPASDLPWRKDVNRRHERQVERARDVALRKQQKNHGWFPRVSVALQALQHPETL